MYMYVEGFGEKRIKLYSIEGTNELLKLEFYHKRKKYHGIIDNSGRLLIPISEVPILEVFATEDRTNYCFTKQDVKTGSYESFHLSKSEDKFYLKADIKGNEITNCRLVGTIKDDYWFIESITDNSTEVSLYDVRNGKILTPGFTEISFEKEESRVLAFVEKDIYSEIDDNYLYLTSLLSYIDYEGNFVSSIYDTEMDVNYDARSYNFDRTFKSYYRFLDLVLNNHRKKIIEKNEHVNEVLVDMFINLYPIEEIKRVNKPAKILKYRRDKK